MYDTNVATYSHTEGRGEREYMEKVWLHNALEMWTDSANETEKARDDAQ